MHRLQRCIPKIYVSSYCKYLFVKSTVLLLLNFSCTVYPEQSEGHHSSATMLFYFSKCIQSISANPASFVIFVLVQNKPILAPTQRPGFVVNVFKRCPEL